MKIGFARANAALRDQVDHALDDNRPAIAGLATKYGLPTAKPIKFAGLQATSSTMIVLAATSETEVTQPAAASVTEAVPKPAAEPVAAAADGGDTVAEGHKIFNGTCSHCHGPDAVQSVKRIDLRLLKHRYGDTTQAVFHETVTKGRPAKGMPNWSAVFSEDDFKKIFAYLNTIQTD